MSSSSSSIPLSSSSSSVVASSNNPASVPFWSLSYSSRLHQICFFPVSVTLYGITWVWDSVHRLPAWHALESSIVETTVQFLSKILSHPRIVSTLANIICQGMNCFLRQPNLQDHVKHMAVEVSKTQPELARRQGEDFPVILSNFIAGMLQLNKKKQSPTTTSEGEQPPPSQQDGSIVVVAPDEVEQQSFPPGLEANASTCNTFTTTTTSSSSPSSTTNNPANTSVVSSPFFSIRDSLPTSKLSTIQQQQSSPLRPNHPPASS